MASGGGKRAYRVDFAVSSRETRSMVLFAPGILAARDEAEETLDRDHPGAGVVGIKALDAAEVAGLMAGAESV